MIIVDKEELKNTTNDWQFNLGEYLKHLFIFFFNHNWRIDRFEFIFWYWTVLFMLAIIPLVSKGNIWLTFSLALSYSVIVLCIKRFHDLNKRWWFILIPIYSIIATFFFQWDTEENRFWKRLQEKEKYFNSKALLLTFWITILFLVLLPSKFLSTMMIIVIIIIYIIFIKMWHIPISDTNPPLLDAIINDNFAEVRKILLNWWNPDTRWQFGLTALHIACSVCNEKIVQELLNHWANPNLRDDIEWCTPLFASSINSYKITKILLYAWANPNIKSHERQFTCIFNAASWGNFKIVKTLIDAGADINIVEKQYGYTPLFMACMPQSWEINDKIIKLFLDNWANPNSRILKGALTPRMLLSQQDKDYLLK